jgi:glycerate 2-kinase
MKVIIATCGHKDYLSPWEAAESIARGFGRARGRVLTAIVPMADGGDGTIEVLVAARGGRIVDVPVHDPLFRIRPGRMGLVGDPPETAVIQIAEAAGSAVLRPHERQTMVATSYGVGELILEAAAAGCRRIVVGLGGSIVSDMGIGMAQALGIEFLDRHGSPLRPICNPGFNALSLADIAGIRLDGSRIAPGQLDVVVASDVDIPLLGSRGQARSFGPQKGASPAEIEYLESGFAALAEAIHRETGRLVDVPFAGAAGGMGAGLFGFLGATLTLGAEFIANEIALPAWIERHDVVVIGEGRLDRTTQLNKGPYFAGMMAKRLGKHVVAIVGTVAPGTSGTFFDDLIACDYGTPDAELSAAFIRHHLEAAAAGAVPQLVKASRSAPRRGAPAQAEMAKEG